MEYKRRLRKLGLWTLEERRNRAEVFKMYTGTGFSILKFELFDSLCDVTKSV